MVFGGGDDSLLRKLVQFPSELPRATLVPKTKINYLKKQEAAVCGPCLCLHEEPIS